MVTGGSARPGGLRNTELAADRACGAEGDLAVPWNRGSEVTHRMSPDRVICALAHRVAAVLA